MTLSQSFLKRILEGGPHAVVICGEINQVLLTADQLRDQVYILAAELLYAPEKRWLLWASDARSFCIQFLALTLASKKIILPGNLVPGTLNRLQNEFDCLITNEEYSDFSKLDFSFKQKIVPADAVSNCEGGGNEGIRGNVQDYLNRDSAEPVEIVLYTSGSTGEPKPVVKTLELMLTEVSVQQSIWGVQLLSKVVVSTVSHQHIYGVLHYVLWPLFRRAAIVNQPVHYPEMLLKIAKGHPPVVVVSSPTHLKRLPMCEEVMAQGELSELVSTVFSSTGVLQKGEADRLADILGKYPFEIFGSTETGGVAWRQQVQSQCNTWTPFPGVSVSQSDTGCLSLVSDFMIENVYEMSDIVEFPVAGEQGFTLGGRIDKIAKVEGKRLSLIEMESRLNTHEFVSQAKVIVVSGKRDEVFAVVELNTFGKLALNAKKKRAVNLQFKKHLANFFEQPLLPRRWRYVDAMPNDSQGKVPHEKLVALF